MSTPIEAPADAGPASWVNAAPAFARPYLRLARFDRPVGFWLLALPCLIGLALAAPAALAAERASAADLLRWAAAFALGAVAMRGAGCTWNDMLDRDLDAQVTRTAGRPLASGALTMRQAAAWLAAQCCAGLVALLMLPPLAQAVALASLPLVALYPLMKRITWWPQAWLGLTFNWGALVAGAAARGELTVADLTLYAGLVAWTIGYDTVYALQDVEDDALIGVRSTARLFGRRVRLAVAAAYALAAAGVAAAGSIEAGGLGAALALPFALHLAAQVARLRRRDAAAALSLFRSNRDAGLLLLGGWGFILLASSGIPA
jgi:4-hydroxybenzoate polyprenyltransferase